MNYIPTITFLSAYDSTESEAPGWARCKSCGWWFTGTKTKNGEPCCTNCADWLLFAELAFKDRDPFMRALMDLDRPLQGPA